MQQMKKYFHWGDQFEISFENSEKIQKCFDCKYAFFGEGNWSSEEKENVENIWVRILFGQWRRGSSEKKKYLEKENIWSAEVVEKEENI